MPSNTYSQHFSAVSSVFEDSASTASYTVYEIKRDGHVLNSQFTSKTRAFDFARNYTSQSSQVYVYKTKCIKIFDADQTATSGSSYTDNTLGVQTRSQQSSTADEDTAFARNVDMLIQAAEQVDYNSEDDADYVPSGTDDDDDDYDDMPDLEYDISGLKFSNYGKGYLLMPNADTDFIGTKYLNDGWWNQSQGGWFFRSQYYDDLIEAGAIYTGERLSSETSTRSSTRSSSKGSTGAQAKERTRVGPSPFSETRDLSGFSIEPYGKGFIVRCAKSNPLFRRREPYLLGNLGWWNSNGQGWFFQNQYQAEVARLGATVIKQEPVTTTASSGSRSRSRSSGKSRAGSSKNTRASARSNFVTSDTQFMEATPEFQQYGKGWLLPASEHYTFEEHGKYFQGGFWMPKNNGWFFRTADRDAFVA